MPQTVDPQTPVQWPSPWPYDFPVAGEVKAARDKVARVATSGGPRAEMTMTRRNVFSGAMAGWGLFAAAGGLASLGLVRFLFPNTSFEPPQVFRTAEPEKFGPETVDETWKEQGVWIVNTAGRIVAISTVCTHLGCTPNWLSGEQKFKCPCHGSGYYINGVNFEGPTPRPLERFAVSVGPDGILQVDKTVKCQVEKGACETSQFWIPA